ncbi:hypothetical protein QTU96_003251 [Enterobacter asburiae]|uniref:hypothetical protein n=1 Tax=Enterobacter cloacae complex TaxID=354276 RepID=UPI0012B72FFF|nr:hypothetical protein [Enterobacter asburiae]MCB7497808.1 hypothetical protein [Enterobacter roggenkampii]ELP5720898.1 hypothetical protein [Enterobacter asburiae]MCU3444295.1 hypothetical protein [Enterobacter asburiae]MEB2410495.1 hypothetical protein [Enterobacter asburiae]HAS0917429.1 hypothetical protein [Enterobacter asburiae]
MSGSGGYSGGRDVTTSCERLRFETVLSSPKPITAHINIGERLTIELIDDDVYALYNGQLAGGISANEAARLKHCLSGGHIFTGTVISAKLGSIKISINPGP